MDGFWKVRVSGDARVRTSGGRSELLVPVPFRDSTATLTQEYDW
ncbi:MAG: hypothetical protein U0736_12085 [Gemmataceae bacterium]